MCTCDEILADAPVWWQERVDIHELTWEDRERVLRLLFSKINNSSPLYPLPPHSLQPDPAPSAAALPGMMQMLPPSGADGHEHDLGPLPDQYAGDAFFVTQPPPA